MPLTTFDEYLFMEMSQKGLCTCDAMIVDENMEEAETPLNCACYVCPEGSQAAFGYVCEEPIHNDCYSFNCALECNAQDTNTCCGPTDDDIEDPPATLPPSAARSCLQTPLSFSVWVLFWVALNMGRSI
jgi:hypothetical protein